MRSFVPEKVMRWLGPAVIIVIGLFVIVGNPVGQDLFCKGTGNCLATWVAGLSGWAAALAAAITIRSLFQQAKAAQQQTDFQLGDADPTFDAVQHVERSTRVVLQIRNWNRRAMIIRRIRLITARKITIMHIAFPKERTNGIYRVWPLGWTFAKGGTKKFEPAIMIDGWVSRDQPPPVLKLSIAAHLENQIEVIDEWREIPIEVQYELVGIRRISRLTAHIHLASMAIALDEDAQEAAGDQAPQVVND